MFLTGGKPSSALAAPTTVPVADGAETGANVLALEYGVYSADEARRVYPHMFSAIGDPNVRYLD